MRTAASASARDGRGVSVIRAGAAAPGGGRAGGPSAGGGGRGPPRWGGTPEHLPAGGVGDELRDRGDLGVAELALEGGHDGAAVRDLALHDRERGLELVEVRADGAGRAGRLQRVAARAGALEDLLPVGAELGRRRRLGPALAAAAALVKAAETEAAAITEELDAPERGALRRAFGEGSTGKGVAKAVRGSAGAMKELEGRQKSRATRLKRDALDRALLDLAVFYRDVLAVQGGAQGEVARAGHEDDVRKLATASRPEAPVRRTEAVMACRERLELHVDSLLAVEEMTLALAAR